MRLLTMGLAAAVALAGAAPGQVPQPAAKVPRHRVASALPSAAGGGMQVASWASLDDSAKASARAWVGRDSVITIDPNGSEHVTVFGKRRDRREQDWRGDIGAATPSYEASNSGSAQSAYTSYPEWDSPQEMQTMSSIKDALGLCNVPPFTCPGGNQ